MKIFNIKDFKDGWFIGDFEPSIIRFPFFEISHHFHKAGCKSEPHIHKVSMEVNYIVSGCVIASENILNAGDFFIYYPNEISKVEFLSDTNLLIIRIPSISTDKKELS